MMRNDFDWMKEIQEFSTRMKSYFENFEHAGSKAGAFIPPGDVYQVGDAFTVEVELPGVPKNEIRVTLSGNVLEISGDKRNNKIEGAKLLSSGRSFGPFSKRVQLPMDAEVDLATSSASYENGVLVITLPKRAKDPGSSIPVN